MAIHPAPTRCDACGEECPTVELRGASVASLNALAAVGLSEPDDPDPVPWYGFLDRNWDCPSCRSRVHLRRLLGAVILFLLLPLALAVLLRPWLP